MKRPGPAGGAPSDPDPAVDAGAAGDGVERIRTSYLEWAGHGAEPLGST